MAVDPCFADLLADKRNELRPPPAHITLDMMRAANKSFLVSVPKTPVHSIDGSRLRRALRRRSRCASIALAARRPPCDPVLPRRRLRARRSRFPRLDMPAAGSQLRLRRGVGRLSAGARSTFPRPVEECHAALAWIVAHAGELGLDANRCTLRRQRRRQPCDRHARLAKTRGPDVHYLALLYPMVDPACDTPSMHEFARGYLLTRAPVQWSWGLYLADPNDTQNPLAAPMHAEPAAFPPTTIVTAEFDPLRDEGEALAPHDCRQRVSKSSCGIAPAWCTDSPGCRSSRQSQPRDRRNGRGHHGNLRTPLAMRFRQRSVP